MRKQRILIPDNTKLNYTKILFLFIIWWHCLEHNKILYYKKE